MTFKISIILSSVAVLVSISCNSNIDGKYTIKEGKCYKDLIFKSLGYNNYNIALIKKEGINYPPGEKFDILGKKEGNKISSKLGNDTMDFIIKEGKITLYYKGKICNYEKAD